MYIAMYVTKLINTWAHAVLHIQVDSIIRQHHTKSVIKNMLQAD